MGHFWVPEGVWDPKWVIFGPPLKPPMLQFNRQKRSIWAQKGSKRGPKGVKKGSKWTILGSILGPRGIFGVIEHFSCTPVLGGGLRPPGDPKMGQKWIKTGKKGHFGPILGPVSGPP